MGLFFCVMEEWKKQGKELGALYIVVMYDPEDKEEYPVFLKKVNLKKELSKLSLSEGKQKVIDIFKL